MLLLFEGRKGPLLHVLLIHFSGNDSGLTKSKALAGWHTYNIWGNCLFLADLCQSLREVLEGQVGAKA